VKSRVSTIFFTDTFIPLINTQYEAIAIFNNFDITEKRETSNEGIRRDAKNIKNIKKLGFSK